MKKLLFISHSNILHGAEICLLETVRSLDDHYECEIHVVLPVKSNGYLERELRAVGVILHYARNPHWVGKQLNNKQKIRWLKSTLKGYFEFYQIVKSVKPDYVINNTIVSNPYFLLLARMMRIRTCWYIHELGDLDHGLIYYFGKRLSYRLVQGFSSRIIFNSNFTKNHFEKNIKRGLVLDYCVNQHNSIKGDHNSHLRKFENISQYQILIAGRTVEGKGQIDIVKAFDVLVNQDGIRNIHLIILGYVPGPYSLNLIEFVSQNKLNEYIEFIDFTNEPKEYFNRAHIGITCSRHEAFGRITVEYMKNGVIAIGGNSGGTNEIIREDVGFLYETGNHLHLANLIKKIISGVYSLDIVAEAKKYAESRFNSEKHAKTLFNYLFD